MSPPFARSLTDLFRLNGATVLDDVLLNRLLGAIEARLKPLEGGRASLDTAIAQVRQVGLDRINEVLTPALQAVFDIQERGFLIASSTSQGTLGAGNILTLVVDDPDERALFTPSPFTALTRAATPDDYGIARTIAFDKETGEYLCEVISFEGDPGPHSDWVIGALAGPTIAMVQLLADGQAARAGAEAAAAGAGLSAASAGDDAAAAAASAGQALGHAQDADASALAAAASAAAAQTFDPNSYYAEIENLIAGKASKAGDTFTGPVIAKAADGRGSVKLVSGDDVGTGFVDFLDQAGGRVGYIGYGSGGILDFAGAFRFGAHPLVPDQAYGVAWDGNLTPPTKNALFHLIESLGSGTATVATATKTDTASATSTSWVDTGLEVTIDCGSPDSRVMLDAMLSVGGSANTRAVFRLVRVGGGTVAQGDAASARPQILGGVAIPSASALMTIPLNAIDHPGAAGSFSYRVQWQVIGTAYLNRSSSDTDDSAGFRAASFLSAMEVTL